MLNWENLAAHTQILLHQLHYAALTFMLVAYAIKIRQMLKKTMPKEGTPSKGDHGKAIRYSFRLLAMPWEMESQRTNALRWLEFAFFHAAMAVGIGVAFTMPWGHAHLAHPYVVYGLQATFGIAALIGASRLLRRLTNPAVRAVSTPDDYFCIVLLTAWMATVVMMAPQTSETWLLAYFVLATFFLFYVPFSKISHYVFWPFMRYYMGKHFGHRGVYPKKRVANS